MKKINNKFRGNAVYSLNYKFDSVSPAGKCSGTALDLIKRYNELAKEAQNNGDYVGMEVFRQYAEHYRKIVTEINERKYQARDNQNNNVSNAENSTTENSSTETEETANNGLVETQSAEPAPIVNETPQEETTPVRKPRKTRAFTVIDASNSAEKPVAETVFSETEAEAKPQRRRYTRKPKATAEA
ncbi:MAG: DUF4167 domain-containing protein [Alphaproteobacteria bacterium]|nr:DUF4167 domain-containing protein [Alphaproteobacteria bacterium]